MKPLLGSAAFPGVGREGLYCFDPEGEKALAAMVDEARAIVDLLGWRGAGAATSLEDRLVAGVAHAWFGQDAPAEATLDEDCLEEQAGDRNPRLPSWEGFVPLVSLAMSTEGTIGTPGIRTWHAGVQATRARAPRQGRSLREERKNEAKKNGKSEGEEKGEGE